MTEHTFKVDEPGARLDRFLAARCPGVSRTQLQKLIDQQRVKVEGKPARAARKLAAGETVTVRFLQRDASVPQAEELALKVVYEDDHLLVIDKPAGLVVHPAPGHSRHTLVNALLAHCPELARSSSPYRPGIVHRLDKDTSGLMVVAKSSRVQELLIDQFKGRRVKKTYLALVDGIVTEKQGVIEGPIGRDPDDRKLMAVVEGGREARTRFKVVRYAGNHTLLEAMPETGRTHQIRVHLAAIGYPVSGDRIYGRKSPHLRRQFLHSAGLAFTHPVTGKEMEFSSPLPEELEQVLHLFESGL